MAACPEKLGWPAFYAGMCQGQHMGGDQSYDQYGHGQDEQWEDQGGQWQDQGGYYEEHQGQDHYPLYNQVDTSERQEESLIGAAAALHLSDDRRDNKTYYT